MLNYQKYLSETSKSAKTRYLMSKSAFPSEIFKHVLIYFSLLGPICMISGTRDNLLPELPWAS